MKKKLSILLFCVLGALIVLLGVITYINFQSGDKYKKQVLSQAQQKYQNRTMPAFLCHVCEICFFQCDPGAFSGKSIL